MNKIKIVCLVGPSGSGKTTVASFLEKKFAYHESISHTSRSIRTGEVEGVNYFYLSRSKMLSMCSNLEFVEFVEFMGNLYAVHSDQLLNYGNRIVIVVEPGGASEILEWAEGQPGVDVSLVYLDISKEAQFERMSLRGDKEDIIVDRIKNETIRRDSLSLDFSISINTELVSSESSSSIINSLLGVSND